LVYIGVSEEERGRLILYDITNPQQPQKIILTPKDLTVRQFQIYPQGDRLIFTATDPSRRNAQQNLFTVTTGINNLNTQNKVLPGKLERILENQDYDNQTIALARDGQMLVLARQNAQNPADAGLWVMPQGESPRPLGIKADEFVVAPNGGLLAVGQEGGVGLIPLNSEAGPSQFLSGLGKALDFSPKGDELLLTQQNQDSSYSLVIYDLKNRTQREILRGPYPLLTCRFDPRSPTTAYCLQADFVQRQGETPQPEPYLAVIDLTSGQTRPLISLPNYPEVDLTIAPDGLALLFDQVATATPLSPNDLLTNSKMSIVDGQVWLLPLPGNPNQQEEADPNPQELTSGFAPQWMP
jgi:dipeptidyl aminopeptidase/acylaminoacyl peptidase